MKAELNKIDNGSHVLTASEVKTCTENAAARSPIETDRLILREIQITDVDAMFELDSDPEVHKYIGNEPVTSKEQIKEVISFIQGQYHDKGIGRWAVVRKADNRFIGWVGLKLEDEDFNGHGSHIDLGYRLTPKYWGHGYATEAAKAWIDYAFQVMKFPIVCALVEKANTASINVLEKVGMKATDAFVLDDKEHLWYEIKCKSK